ncbi:MAG: hypothetical protein ACPKOI_03505 [Pleomorphochaeta sp.]
MFYINKNGDRYPQDIYQKLDDKKRLNFIAIEDNEYFDMLNKANSTNKKISIEYNKVVLVDRVVSEIDKLKNELNSLQSYMDSTDWISSKCYDLELKVKDEYPIEYEKRNSARLRIHELKQILYG